MTRAFDLCNDIIVINPNFGLINPNFGLIDCPTVCKAEGDRFFKITIILNDRVLSIVKSRMGLIKLKIREFASEKGWTLKDVAERSGVAYSSVRAYARTPGLSMVDYTSLVKMARALDVMIEDLVEVLEE